MNKLFILSILLSFWATTAVAMEDLEGFFRQDGTYASPRDPQRPYSTPDNGGFYPHCLARRSNSYTHDPNGPVGRYGGSYEGSDGLKNYGAAFYGPEPVMTR